MPLCHKRLSFRLQLNDVEARQLSYFFFFRSWFLFYFSEILIKALRSDEESFDSFGYLLPSISFSCTGIVRNTIAHNLAKHERHISDWSVWMEDIPSHLHNILLANYG